ncbi:MAG: MFS transporter [Coraliomargaritaceae bacterium]
MPPATDKETVTYRYDCWRSVLYGICEAGWVTFGLLILIRNFCSAEDEWGSTLAKSLITSAGFLGLLLTTTTTYYFSRLHFRATSVVAVFLIASGFLLASSAFVSGLVGFTVLFAIANILSAQQSPFLTETYAVNYRAEDRGKRVSTVLVFVALSTASFSYLAGWLLDLHFAVYPLILLLMALASWGSAFFAWKIPSRPIAEQRSSHPFGQLAFVYKDKLFGWLLSAKMLMGFANLMTLPIRIEVLANPQFGINATNGQIVLASVIIPSVIRVLFGRTLGMLFDRWNYIAWRILVNGFFIVGILLYFTSDSLPWIYLGSVFVGLGMSGGSLSWNLWVTKIAPFDKVATYMSVHSTLTGVRGILAPLIGYILLWMVSPIGLASVCVCMILVSTLMYSFLWNHPRFKKGINNESEASPAH